MSLPLNQTFLNRNGLGNRCGFTRVASRRSVDHGNVSCTWATSCRRMVDYRQRWDPTPTTLANFSNNEGHVVGEGTVPPRSHAVEDRLLHIREC